MVMGKNDAPPNHPLVMYTPNHHISNLNLSPCLPSQDEDLSHSLIDLLHTTRGRVTVGFEIGVLLCMLPFLVIDITMASIYRLQWICDPWHILSTLTYVNQVGWWG